MQCCQLCLLINESNRILKNQFFHQMISRTVLKYQSLYSVSCSDSMQGAELATLETYSILENSDYVFFGNSCIYYLRKACAKCQAKDDVIWSYFHLKLRFRARKNSVYPVPHTWINECNVFCNSVWSWRTQSKLTFYAVLILHNIMKYPLKICRKWAFLCTFVSSIPIFRLKISHNSLTLFPNWCPS